MQWLSDPKAAQRKSTSHQRQLGLFFFLTSDSCSMSSMRVGAKLSKEILFLDGSNCLPNDTWWLFSTWVQLVARLGINLCPALVSIMLDTFSYCCDKTSGKSNWRKEGRFVWTHSWRGQSQSQVVRLSSLSPSLSNRPNTPDFFISLPCDSAREAVTMTLTWRPSPHRAHWGSRQLFWSQTLNTHALGPCHR